MQLRQGMQERFLRHVPDLARMSRKFQAKTKATLQDAWRLYQFVQQIAPMREALEEALENLSDGRADLFRASIIDPLAELEASFKDYGQLVEQSLDLDGLDDHEYRINPKYDDELGELADEKERIKGDIENERYSTAKKLGLPDDKVKLERSKGVYSMRITRKDEKVLRSKPAFTVLETRKDGVKFTCKDLKPLSDAYKRCDDEYNAKQTHLVSKVIDVISTYSPAVDDLCSIIAEIDVIVSLAHVSCDASTPYVRPTLTEAGEYPTMKRR
jgi:DNA mismatch repair protein MSH2